MSAGSSTSRIRELHVHALRSTMLLEVRDDGGLSGWSEVGGARQGATRQLIETDVARCAKGAGIWDAEPLWERIHEATKDTGVTGLAALGAFDIALWDLRGKLAGLPVHKLLGGRTRERIAACGTIRVEGGRTDAAAAQAAKFAAAGYRALRLALSPGDLPLNAASDPAIKAAAAVRAASGASMVIIVNLGGAYMATRAVEVARRLHGEFGVQYVEDPVQPELMRDLAQVSDGVDALVCAGGPGCTRWVARDLIDHGKADVLAPELATSGGITEAKKIAALAQSQSKPLMPRAPHGALLRAAALHLSASVLTTGPAIDGPGAEDSRLYRNPPEFKDGYLLVPQSPGLGVEVDLGQLAKERAS
jgi:L-alanine-DL-glutamate epimerase-like enolase superfamily enzyme